MSVSNLMMVESRDTDESTQNMCTLYTSTMESRKNSEVLANLAFESGVKRVLKIQAIESAENSKDSSLTTGKESFLASG